MSRDSSADVEEPGIEEIERAVRAAGMPAMPVVSRATPLDYASRHDVRRPFDWGNSLRQLVFAAGVGFIAGAATDVWGYNPWKDGEVLWIGFGAAFIALTMSWPGRIGWRR